MRNFGSTTYTPNFNDSLTFETTAGHLAHKHSDNTNKLVSLIDYQNFNINKWFNENNYEIGLDFYYTGYAGYQQILEMYRTPEFVNNLGQYTDNTSYFVGYEIRWVSNTFGQLTTTGQRQNPGTIQLKSGNASAVSNQWVSLIIKKNSSETNVVFKTDSNILSNLTFVTPTLNETQFAPRYLTLFGYYCEGNTNLNQQRHTKGATKNFYCKII